MTFETAFGIDTSSIKYGPGVTREVGYEVKRLGATRVMVVTDRNLASSEPVSVAFEALRVEGINAMLFNRVYIEPTDKSFKGAIRFATGGCLDGCDAVRGSSGAGAGFRDGQAGGMLRGEVEEKEVK